MTFEIRNGSFGYPHSEHKIVDGLSFSVDDGDVLTILGPNGAGKTTVLKCAMGLLKWGFGCSLLDGEDIRSLGCRSFWQSVSYVPQARQTSSGYTVEEMILLGRTSRIMGLHMPGKRDMDKLGEVMDRLKLKKLRKKRCSEISGGELQMVLIARALAAEPRLLILDEPESNLDFGNQLLVLDTISELSSQGMACIFNTHYPAHALRRSNKALLLSPGGRYECGETHRVVTEENIGKYFGVQAIIGDIETPGNIYRDVVPIAAGKGGVCTGAGGHVVACLSVLMPDRSKAERINEILHSASKWIVGRMGMPHPESGIYVINLVLDAPECEVRRLTEALNLIPEISVKATYAKEADYGQQQTAD